MIDNASTDNSTDIIKSLSADIKIISLDKNHGFAGGYNQGLQHIKSDYYFLLNSDLEVTANWLAPLLTHLESADVGAVVPKIRSHADRSSFEYAGAAGGYLDKHGYAFCRGRVFDVMESDQGQYDDVASIAWASGCAFGIKASLFHALGGFDASFFAHYEEIDLCWRLRRAGYKILCIPSSTVYHLGGGTMSYASTRKLQLNFRNSLYMLYKNLSGWTMFNKIFSRLVLDGVAAIVFLFEGKFNYIAAIFKAHIQFYQNLRRLSETKKEEGQRIDKISLGTPRHDGEIKKSIIYNFFFLKNKTYREIINE